MNNSLVIEDFDSVDNVFNDRSKQLIYCAESICIDGSILEFGVWEGTTINLLADTLTNNKLYGFDSFEGLPEKWIRTSDGKRFSKKGEFAVQKLPEVRSNVQLIKGWFKNSLPVWKKNHPNAISLIHIDSDLYSSSKTILSELNDQIIPGTILIFDELCDWKNAGIYDLWESGEWKALLEWLETYGREVEPISRTNWLEGSLIVIK